MTLCPLCFSCATEEKESLILLNFAQIVKDNNEEFYQNFVKKEIMEDSTLDQLNETGLLKHVSISSFSVCIRILNSILVTSWTMNTSKGVPLI